MSTTHRRTAFQVGDRVRIGSGRYKLTGVIVEDRGAIGVGGRRLFQVSIPIDPFEPMTMELPEDEMEAAPAEAEAPASMDKQKITDYLVNGGLISILHSNLSGGRNQPRAWLCPDQLGNVTHTFVSERGVIGGQVVPSGALREDKIAKVKREAVVSFVESFGLSHQEAENVVSEIGTAR